MENLLQSRRSVRLFKDEPVPEEVITSILQDAMFAPSAANQQPWEFIVVTEKPILEKISNCSPFAKVTAKAPAAIVVLMNTSETHRFPQYAPQDCSACCQNILLSAHAQGIGSVWLGFFPEEDRQAKMREVFGYPENLTAFAVIPIGYPVQIPPMPQMDSRFKPERIHRNSY